MIENILRYSHAIVNLAWKRDVLEKFQTCAKVAGLEITWRNNAKECKNNAK